MDTRILHSSRAALVVATLLVLLAVLTLVACGASGTTASSSPSAAPGAAAVTATPSPSWSPTMSPAPIPVVKPGGKLPPFAKIAALYAYDSSEPFDTSLGICYEKNGATVQQVAYKHDGESLAATLVTPGGEGPFPVVVYAPGWTTAGEMWLSDALVLAKKGYAGLLLEESGGPFWTYHGVQGGRAFVNYTVHARRGLDLLETMPQIDAKRIGFVAWSNGGRLGSFLSGVDDRIKAFVFVGLNNEDVATWSAAEQADIKARGVSPKAYAAQMSIFDPALYFSRNTRGAFLFVWGKAELDPIVKAWYLRAAPKHSTWRLHPGGHELNPGATPYVDAWIQKNL